MSKKYTILTIIGLIIITGFLVSLFSRKSPSTTSNTQCQIKEMTFYFADWCPWCQKVKNEGTIKKLRELGIKINEINVDVGPVKHQFQGIPAFVIDEKVYSGYKTFDELKKLLGCSIKESQLSQNKNQTQPSSGIQFIGEKGEKLILENGEVRLSNISIFDDNQARFYNVLMPNGKTIYFFVLKDKKGIYRAAANACQVCFGTGKGFHQEGDEIVCNNCGNRYPIEKIATEKGGCNPGPINPNLEVRNGQIIIKQNDLEKVLDLF